MHKIKVNKTELEALYNTGTSLRVMSKWFFHKLKKNKPKLTKYNRTFSGAGGGTLIAVGECFVQLQIGKKIFRDRVILIKNVTRDYILGHILHSTN